MAYDYNRAKQVWDSMNDQQKKQYTEQNKNDTNFQQFAQQYHEEKQQTAPRQVQANVNVDNLQNQQPAAQRDSNWVYTGNTEREKEQNRKMLEEQQRRQDIEQKKQEALNNKIVNASPDFDSSRLTNPNAEVSVKEGKAAQTWTPDYEEDSEARMNEITNNLNAYWNNNKSYFSDRATFNSTFHYNDRSDKQKALLDSFWKWTQDQIKANSYHNWDEIMSGFDNWEITPDIMSYLRTYNEAAYDEWQKKMEDKVNTLIANMAAPRDVWDTAELWQNLVKKFWLEAWDPYDIYWEWSRRAEELWVFRDSQQLASMSNNIASIYSTMNSNVQSISSQLEGRYSAWYIAARIDKANSKLNSQAQSMQYSYNLLLQNRNQNMAIAQQAAAMKQAQGQEDSRIFNQKLAWLGFAMQADSYRTPEQQAQLQLQTAQIQNDMNLLNQSKLNDLSLYNQKQLNDLNLQYQADLFRQQNKLQNELTDLSVSDPEQLRANLNNVLSQYYAQWWDIIQRPQAQALDDILAYAKEKGISVAQALKENFVEPLQSKKEYKNAISAKYPSPVSNITSWVTINSDWSIDFWVTTEWWLTYTPISNVELYWGYRDFENWVEVWSVGWWCWKFVNDYLQSLWYDRFYWDSISSKLKTINTWKEDASQISVWSVAVFDYTWAGKAWLWEDAQKYGHVAIVAEVDEAWGRVRLLESNLSWNKKITNSRWVSLNNKTLKWFFDPSKWSDAAYINTNGYNPNLANDINAQALLKQIETWEITDTAISEARKELIAKWYGQEFMNALDRWFKVKLNDSQQKMLKQTLDMFNGNQIVKDFEQAWNQMWTLITALNANNWAWDLAAIFTFMKVLDPRSVVRWEEFENAAATAWYANPEALYQKYINHGWDGTWLTEAQKWNFKQLAIELIKNQSKIYNQKYKDAIRYLDNANIDEMWYPTNYADLIVQSIEWDAWSSNLSYANNKSNINWYEQYTSWGNNNQVYSDWLPNDFYSFWS